MPDNSSIDINDDIIQAYLSFKKKDYQACLNILEENIVFVMLI